MPGWPKEKSGKSLTKSLWSGLTSRGSWKPLAASYTGRQLVFGMLDLLSDPQEYCRRSGPKVRRALNKVIFDRLYVGEGTVEGHRLAPVASELVQATIPAGSTNDAPSP